MNVIITGAARGIGKAIAAAFAAQGHTLFLCARNEETLQKTCTEIQQKYSNSKLYYKVADLAIKKEADAFANWCISQATPDILVNNAGSFTPGFILEEADGSLETMLQNNVMSAYYVTKIIAAAMVQQKQGYIFNISSVAGLQAYEQGGSYSISKFALNGFSQNLRHELKNKGVKVTTVFPGAVYTDSWVGFDNSSNRIMEVEDIAKMIVACTSLSQAAVPEEIVIRPQLGDL